MDENGTFIHNHPLDLDNFIIDVTWANGKVDEYNICTDFSGVPEDIERYVQNNGETIKYNKKKRNISRKYS